jgi:FkbM family methyltransferase
MLDKIIRFLFVTLVFRLIKLILKFPLKVGKYKNTLWELFIIKLMSYSDEYFIENRGIFFYSVYRICAIRGSTAWTKEKDTVNWIDDQFKDGDVFFDIGANIGVYSLIANKLKNNLKIYSFEPESQSYSILNRNIRKNDAGNIIAYNLALSDEDSISFLSLSSSQPAKSNHQLNDTAHSETQQGIISFKLDTLLEKYQLPAPNHIKIDVDGIELKIIYGMLRTLKNKKLKSIAIEIDFELEGSKKIEELILEQGFIRLTDDNYINSKYEISNCFFIRNNLQ